MYPCTVYISEKQAGGNSGNEKKSMRAKEEETLRGTRLKENQCSYFNLHETLHYAISDG